MTVNQMRDGRVRSCWPQENLTSTRLKTTQNDSNNMAQNGRESYLAVEQQLDRVFGGLEEQQRLSATGFFQPSEECNPEQTSRGLT